MEKCNVKGLGLAIGVTWALYMLFLGWAAAFGWGTDLVKLMSSMYLGFHAGFWGGIVGAIWGFVDGFVGGALIAFFYNKFTGRR